MALKWLACLYCITFVTHALPGPIISRQIPDPLCRLSGDINCSGPFPPGNASGGGSWWQIGKKSLGVTILQMSAFVKPDPANPLNTGIMDVSNPYQKITRSPFAQIPIVAGPGVSCDQTQQEWCVFPSFYSNGHSTIPKKTLLVDPAKADSVNLFFNYPSHSALTNNKTTPMYRARAEVIGSGGIKTLPWEDKSSSGFTAPYQLWLKTECLCEAQGNIPQHTYANLTIALDKPSLAFGKSINQNDTDYTTPYTPDNGKTWQIDQITIYDSWCVSNKTCEN
ncbi:MAG: hypothetical protein Q9162_005212 [Coniocarpon cinnabarinum]